MTELIVTEKIAEWHRLKALVLDSVSSPIRASLESESRYWMGRNKMPNWAELEYRNHWWTVGYSNPDRVLGSGEVVGNHVFWGATAFA